MKDKGNLKTKLGFQHRKKKGRTPEEIHEREISPEDLAKLIAESSDQEDHLQDLDFIMPQKKHQADHQADLEHNQTDSIEEENSDTEKDAAQNIAQPFEKMPIDLDDHQLFNEELVDKVRKETETQEQETQKQENREIETLEQKNQEKREKERRTDEQSVPNRIVNSQQSEATDIKRTQPANDKEEKNKPTPTSTKPTDQSKQANRHTNDGQYVKTEPLIEQMVEEEAKNLLGEFKDEFKNKKTVSQEKALNSVLNSANGDEQIMEEETPTAHDDHASQNENAKPPKSKSSFQQKAKKILSQWQVYFIFGAALSLLVLLWKIHALHFFKLSFAGLILGLGATAIVLAIFCFFYTRRRLWSIMGVLLCVLVVTQSIGLQKEMRLISNSLEEMSSANLGDSRTMGIYVPAMIPISNIEALDGETIGMMSGRDDEGIHAVLEDLDSRGIHVKTRSYSSLQQLYKGVRGLAVRAVILNFGDVRLIEDFSGSQNQASQLLLTYSLHFSNPVENKQSEINLEEDSSTILISGSSDPLDEISYRSNFNALLTINPKTKEILTVILPRTLAINSACEDQLACLAGDQQDRLSLISYHSIEALRQTVEAYLDTPIDFTVRVDIHKILQLFDLDTSIRYQEAKEVDSFAAIQNGAGEHLNGPQIKQLLGSTNDLAPEDFEQELTLLRVFSTLIHSQVLPNTKDLNPILEILKQSISTSMNPEQLSQLIKMFLIFPQKMNESYTLLGSNSNTQYSPTLTETVYMSTVDPASLLKVQTAIHAALNGEPFEVEPLPTPSLFEAIEQSALSQSEQSTTDASQSESSTELESTQETEPQTSDFNTETIQTPSADEVLNEPEDSE